MELLTTEDVARVLGKSARWVRELALEGRIEHYKVGSSYRFTPTHIQLYLDSTYRGGFTYPTENPNPWGRATRRRF